MIHHVRRVGHQAAGGLHLGEGDHVPDALGLGDQHHQPVQAVGQAAVGRRAVFEGLHQEPEPGPGLLLGEAQGLEHLLLKLRGMDPDGAAADLVAVHDHIIGLGPDPAGIRIHVGDILVHGAGKGMVHGHETLFLLVVLQQGEIHHPQQVDHILRDQVQPLGHLLAQGAQGGVDHAVIPVRHEQQQIPGLGPSLLLDGVDLLRGEELGKGALEPIGLEAHPGQALGPINLHEGRELIQLFPGELFRAPLDVDAAHAAARLHGPRKGPEAAALHRVAHIAQLQPIPGIRLVGAIAVHGLLPGDPPKGQLHVIIQGLLEQPGDEALVYLQHVVPVHKAHLQVDLGEFRLPVRPQVLVPEAPGDLHIPVVARKHQELLELLGALGQGVELARLHPAGHQIVPGPFRGALAQDGGLDLQEPLLVKVLAGHLGHLVAQHDVLLHTGPPKVQIPVLEPDLFGSVQVVLDIDGGRLGNAEDLQLLGPHLVPAGGHVFVDHLLVPLGQYALDRQHVFVADGGGQVEYRLGQLALVEGHLHDPAPVP